MPKTVRSLLVLCAVFATSLAGHALAKNVTADVQQIAALLTKSGKSVEVKTVEGDTYVRITGTDSYSYSIFIYGCNAIGASCKSVQFFAAFDPKQSPTLEMMNAYASENRWGRIYLDKDGEPAIEFDLDLEQGGMSEELFLDNVAYWDAIIEAYGDFVFAKDDENLKPK